MSHRALGFVCSSFVVLSVAACAPDTEVPDFDDGEEMLESALGADDYEIIRGGRYDIVRLYGELAESLFETMDDSGVFNAHDTNSGLHYLYGRYSLCVTNGSAFACEVYSDTAEDGASANPYLLKMHGRRGQSGPTELFAALSYATGVTPQSTSFVERGPFLCGKSASQVWCAVSNDQATLEVTLGALGDLGSDYVYEGWLITDDGPVTTGRFSMSSSQETFEFTVDAALEGQANAFVLTIEPAVGDAPEPSSTHIVAGDVMNGSADLSVSHPAALGTDFQNAAGVYILETPSSSDSSDYANGVWFLAPSAGPAAGLSLPTLPAGWVYEGWVVGANGPVSTGTFQDATGADSDAGGPAAGPNGTPPFPGQDFVSPAMSVAGGAVVISVEPSPDNGAGPFFIKPLVDMEAEDVGPGVVQMMGNTGGDTLAFGTATFK